MKTEFARCLALCAMVVSFAPTPTEALGASGRASWTRKVGLEIAKLIPPDGSGGDRFGEALHVNQDGSVVVGAPDHAHLGVDQGAVYRYARNASSWILDQELVASDGESGDLFGSSVTEDSATGVIIGAPGDQVGGARTGSVYIFQWNGTSWVEHQKLVASDAADLGGFGASVSVSSQVLAVGAPGQDGQGAVYMFVWNGAQYVESDKLTAFDGAPGDQFGYSVSARLYVSAGTPGDDDLGTDSGSVYLFDNDSTVGHWPFVGKVTASDGTGGDRFGHSVYGSGEPLAGAPGNDESDLDAGAAYLLFEAGSSWWDTKYVDYQGAPGDGLGCSVAPGEHWAIIVGADGADDGGTDAGAVHVFNTAIGGNWGNFKVTRNSTAAGDRFGRSVGTVDDWIVVGAPGDDEGGPDVGAVTIHEMVDLFTVTCTGYDCLCPCNNRTIYWYFSGCANSTGRGTELTANGTQVVTRDDLVLEARYGIPGNFGMFLQGRSNVSMPFKDGCLCVGYPTERLGVVVFGTGYTADADTSGISLVTKGNVSPGETIYYQLWYRDNSGPCGTGSNLSNGLEVLWR